MSPDVFTPQSMSERTTNPSTPSVTTGCLTPDTDELPEAVLASVKNYSKKSIKTKPTIAGSLVGQMKVTDISTGTKQKQAPECVTKDTSKKSQGCKIGAKAWMKEEMQSLLDCVGVVLPISGHRWAEVTKRFNANAAEAGMPEHTHRSLEQQFKKVSQYKCSNDVSN